MLSLKKSVLALIICTGLFSFAAAQQSGLSNEAGRGQEQQTRLRQQFERLDKDQDGVLTFREFASGRYVKERVAKWGNVPEGIDIQRDIVYVPAGGKSQRLDILRSGVGAEDLRPAIVYIHGGSFRGGDKRGGWPRLFPLVEAGYIGVSLNYRLSREATFPAQIEDCKAAIRYLRRHAEDLGIDPERIGVWGVSAGGYLASLLGTSGDVAELNQGGWSETSSRVQAVCNWYGPADFFRLLAKVRTNDPNSPERQLFGGDLETRKDLVDRASPLRYVSADDPPFLIVHGEADRIIPHEQGTFLFSALQQAGVEVEFVSVPGAGHGGEPFREQQQRVMEFFDRVLAKGEPEL
ncbi:MAG: hypothetical protein C0621_02330 [Desulfuromonas sp.]|nr:MAG: hypothetical protein C0621_02330 [Desulfuromonas sp.]